MMLLEETWTSIRNATKKLRKAAETLGTDCGPYIWSSVPSTFWRFLKGEKPPTHNLLLLVKGLRNSFGVPNLFTCNDDCHS